MSKSVTLEVQPRDRAGKGAARAVRRQGLVPGVIYGDKKDPVMFAIDPRVLMAQMHKPGFWAHTFNVEVSGEKAQVLARDVQFHPVSDTPLHVDFLRVSADAEVTVAVPVRFLNQETCPGLKKGGVLNVVRHDVEMVAKANAIPEMLEVDLNDFDLNDSIHFSAFKGAGSARPTITDRDFTVATIAAPSGLKSEKAEEGEEAEGEEGGEE